MIMSSAFEAICMFSGGCGMSCMKRLKSLGEKTVPRGTPLEKYCVCDDLL